ncbi:MAG: threonine--tRNA ligase [Candidatus Pacebacteria bacterium]|nr:threonine--tRNA ligase [Candidatus Paceibacterota bacterium]
MAEIEHKRHTLAHLLAAAVLERHPNAHLTLGPAIDTGFYYDIDFGEEKISDSDLPKIEKVMRKLLPSWKEFTHKEVSADEAQKLFAGNPFKLELIDEITARGEKITLYTCGAFTDLCRGSHAEHPSKDIDADSFKLDRVAGAYWRGDEKNKMLTRIYGLAFDTKEELDAYLNQREEAKKRDHRKIAREQDLLVFSDLIGSGMPMYTPKGNIVRNAIINYSRELNGKLGFGEVHTPNVNKAELFKLSGHYDAYKEDMLSVRSQYVADEMFLKPMNCPQHTQIYASQPRSYRDLPIRYADFANLYRDERPGELSGLTRLRSFAQDDGHIFCREDQIEQEVSAVLGAIQEALKTYQISYWMRLSLRDPNNTEKYLGDPAVWEKAQNIMRELLKSKNIEFKEAEGEAAFYGPKIDIMAVDAIGRQWQISTVQLDFVQPTRFGLEYTAEDGSKKTPVMIHRALIGSPDRFLGILIEHYAGAFPLWMAPVQVQVLPISEKQSHYAAEIVEALQKNDIRAELSADDSLGKRIRNGKLERVPYFIVVGDKEMEDKTVTVENNRTAEKSTVALSDFIQSTLQKIKERAVV